MKRYCVVYLSPGGIHYRYRCWARNKAEGMCKENIGIRYKDISEVTEEYEHE